MDDALKTAWIKLNEVVRGAPKHPVVVAEYNAWLLRLEKANVELMDAVFPKSVVTIE